MYINFAHYSYAWDTDAARYAAMNKMMRCGRCVFFCSVLSLLLELTCEEQGCTLEGRLSTSSAIRSARYRSAETSHYMKFKNNVV